MNIFKKIYFTLNQVVKVFKFYYGIELNRKFICKVNKVWEDKKYQKKELKSSIETLLSLLNKKKQMIIKKNEVDAIDFNGLEIFDYTAKPNEKSSFAVIKVKPDISHQLSWSTRSDKYYYILNGSLEFYIDDKNISLN